MEWIYISRKNSSLFKSIYISTNEAVDNIQFVNSMKDRQDILYSMSSGQLSAVAISFLLCMNQVLSLIHI